MSKQSSQEKTEPATEHKLREARRKGDVTQSRDLTAAVVLTAGLAMLAFQLPDIAGRFMLRSQDMLQLAVQPDLGRLSASDRSQTASHQCGDVGLRADQTTATIRGPSIVSRSRGPDRSELAGRCVGGQPRPT